MKNNEKEQSFVCRNWHTLVRSRHKSLTIRETPQPFFPLAAWGYHLELLGCDLVTLAGLTYLVEHCQSLAYLHLQCCPHFNDAAVLVVIRRAHASLQHLRVTFCEVTSAAIQILGTLLTVFVC
ncbi:unnamed protein product [Arabis nemorensis]|uniref:COI1 F-box domain-containing protein n=1 Tax=Arabis nemorensis TaxID=586526 RepID=A0A565B619_9BRAS|nr:unnamed protein product [Arabis nemorensis]